MISAGANVRIDGIPPQVAKDYATTITILDHLSDAIFMLDKEGHIQYANKSALEMLKINLVDLKGNLIDEIFPNQQSDYGNTEKLTTQFRKGHYLDINTKIDFNNITIPVYVSFRVVKDMNDEVELIIVSAKDMTMQKSLEKELNNQKIMSISRDRIRALGELSVSMVHDLSQPLATLQMRLDMVRKAILENADEKTQMKNLRELDELVTRINKTVQVVRTFAFQTEDDSIGLINISQAVRNAKRLVNYEMNKRNIKVNIEIENELPFIVGNSLLFEQVFVNLLINARDAFDFNSSDEELLISIKTKIKEKKWIEIHVLDNGSGINLTIADQIFEPFFSTKKSSDNPGLGLTFTKEIISSMGGNIFLSDEYTSGACFIIRIPITQNNERDQLSGLIKMLHTE